MATPALHHWAGSVAGLGGSAPSSVQGRGRTLTPRPWAQHPEMWGHPLGGGTHCRLPSQEGTELTSPCPTLQAERCQIGPAAMGGGCAVGSVMDAVLGSWGGSVGGRSGGCSDGPCRGGFRDGHRGELQDGERGWTVGGTGGALCCWWGGEGGGCWVGAAMDARRALPWSHAVPFGCHKGCRDGPHPTVRDGRVLHPPELSVAPPTPPPLLTPYLHHLLPAEGCGVGGGGGRGVNGRNAQGCGAGGAVGGPWGAGLPGLRRCWFWLPAQTLHCLANDLCMAVK